MFAWVGFGGLDSGLWFGFMSGLVADLIAWCCIMALSVLPGFGSFLWVGIICLLGAWVWLCRCDG